MHSLSLLSKVNLYSVILFLSLISSIAFLIRTIYILINTPVLTAIKSTVHKNNNKISVLLPARNEATRIIKDNIESLMSQTYSNLEILAVDDRSTDNTLNILEDFASNDGNKLKAIKGQETPSGWMGKIFALHQSKQKADGYWLLSVDADVIYSRDIISAGISYADKYDLDALSLLPTMKMINFWEAVSLPAMSWLSIMRVSTTQANRKRSKACFGFGNFILFKRSAHDAIGGFEAYKNDVLDDCAIMERLKSKGFNVKVADGSRLMSTRMYSNLREIFLGFGKNSFAALHFSIFRSLSVILAEILFVLFPFAYTVLTIVNKGYIIDQTFIMANASVGCFFLTMLLFGQRTKADKRFYCFYFIGHVVAVLIILYSMLSFVTGKGVIWKGRKIA